MASEDVRESVVESYLVSQLGILRRMRIKIRVKKVNGMGWRGWPDRVILIQGAVTHWVETKRPRGGKFEPLQLRIHAELRAMGFVVHVINTRALVDAYIADLIHEFEPKRV